MRVRNLVIAALLCFAAQAAFADSVNFVFSGTDALGSTINFTYHADTGTANGGFTVFSLQGNATCTVSTGDPCQLIEFVPGFLVQPSLGFPDGLADRIRIPYGSQLDNEFWFPLRALLNDGSYSTIGASPGTGTLTRAYDPNGSSDDGTEMPPDQSGQVPEPGTLLLLMAAIPFSGLLRLRSRRSAIASRVAL